MKEIKFSGTKRENGQTHHYADGRLHRKNGPAVVTDPDKTISCCAHEQWYWEGEFHRSDGPARVAVEWEEYFIHGVHFETQEQFWQHPAVLEHKLKQIVRLFDELTAGC